jgi:hypothetical protein
MNIVLFVCGYYFFGLEQEQWTSLIRITFRVILSFYPAAWKALGILVVVEQPQGRPWWSGGPGLKKFLRYLFVGVKIKRHRLGHDRPLLACNHVRSILATCHNLALHLNVKPFYCINKFLTKSETHPLLAGLGVVQASSEFELRNFRSVWMSMMIFHPIFSVPQRSFARSLKFSRCAQRQLRCSEHAYGRRFIKEHLFLQSGYHHFASNRRHTGTTLPGSRNKPIG